MSDRLDLDALEALCEAATPGPWTVSRTPYRERVRVMESDGLFKITDVFNDESRSQANPNAEFIAAARTALPALLAQHNAVLALHRMESVEVTDGWDDPQTTTVNVCAECGYPDDCDDGPLCPRPHRRRIVTTVNELIPGDHVELTGGLGGTFIAHVPHPKHRRFRQVIWWLNDGSFSFDCLLPEQYIGDAHPLTDAERVDNLSRALTGETP